MIPLYKTNNKIFITGGTGYIGSKLIPRLYNLGYETTALIRKGSETKLPESGKPIIGNALDKQTFLSSVFGNDTYIQLVGVSNPLPSNKSKFRNIDLISAKESIDAAKECGVKHFIYISVASPAPIMKEYVKVRLEAERMIRDSSLNATILKPWYILGPGHKWPYLLKPFYKIFESIPRTKETAYNLALIKLKSIVSALIFAVQNPANGIRVMRTVQLKKF